MLRIRVNDIFLDLDETTIRYEIVNSILEQNVLQGDWSFPFKIKWSDKNGAALGFANMLEVPNKTMSYPATCFFDTKPFANGRLILNGGGLDYFNANIASGVKGLVNAETKLKDLPFFNPDTGNGTVQLTSREGAALQFQTADYNNIIAFPPHYNPDFYGDANPDFQGIINIVIAEDGTHPQNVTGLGGNKYCLVPFVYLFYILETIIKENGMVPSGSLWYNTELSKALLYNNYALDKYRDLGCTVKNGSNELIEIEDSPGLNSKIITLLSNLPGCFDEFLSWDNTNHWFTILDAGQYDFHFTGEFYGSGSADFLIAIIVAPVGGGQVITVSSIGVTLSPGGTQAVELYEIVPGMAVGDKVYIMAYEDAGHGPTNVTLLTGAQFVIRKYDAQMFNGMTDIVTIKNHMPDMTVSQLFNQIKIWLQADIYFDYSNNKIVINSIDKILQQPPTLNLTDRLGKNYELLFDEKNRGYVVGYDFGTGDVLVEENFKKFDSTKLIGSFNSIDDLPANASAGDLALVKSTNKIMSANFVELEIVWEEFTDNYYDVITGDGETEVKTLLAPMMMIDKENLTLGSPDYDLTRALMPAIREKGSSPMFDMGENPGSIRIVFMRGMNASGGMYICASSTNYDQLGVQQGDLTMKMNDSDGWFKRFHEKIITALTIGDIVERDFSADIDLLCNPQLKGKISAFNIHWLLVSISATIGKVIKVSKSKWLKL